MKTKPEYVVTKKIKEGCHTVRPYRKSQVKEILPEVGPAPKIETKVPDSRKYSYSFYRWLESRKAFAYSAPLKYSRFVVTNTANASAPVCSAPYTSIVEQKAGYENLDANSTTETAAFTEPSKPTAYQSYEIEEIDAPLRPASPVYEEVETPIRPQAPVYEEEPAPLEQQKKEKQRKKINKSKEKAKKGGLTDEERKEIKSKLRKPKISIFETVVSEEELLEEELVNTINKDGYYNEILPEDHGVEYIHKEKKEIKGWLVAVLVLMTLVGVGMIVINVLRL